mmetsp:Transcript_59996/g.164443  ORF Transcript_59996/g.164443 Transcript_59996/m.164443 type:complete len:304 (-) Transcript_59996:716-1627(-)
MEYFPIALAVRRSGQWSVSGSRGTGQAFFGLSASAEEYLCAKLPEVTLVPAASSSSPIAAHEAAWAVLAQSSRPYAIVVELGVLLALNMRELCGELLREANAADPQWEVIHLLNVVDEPMALGGGTTSTLLRRAAAECPGAPAYLISRRGAQRALSRSRGSVDGERGCNDERASPAGAALYAALTPSRGGAFASGRVVAQWGEVPHDDTNVLLATSMAELVRNLLHKGAFDVSEEAHAYDRLAAATAAASSGVAARAAARAAALMARIDRAAFVGSAYQAHPNPNHDPTLTLTLTRPSPHDDP